MKNILVPTDFSEYADNAYEVACEIANHSGAEVTLLHVLEYPVMSIFNTTGEIAMNSISDVYLLNLLERAKNELEMKMKNTAFPKVTINQKIRIGNPYESISAQIESLNVDLVVMGTKGASGLKEMFIGSNAEKVARFANCPVITVPKIFKLVDIKRIAYGVTFRDDHTEVIQQLKKYLDLFKAELHLVWVNSYFDHLSEQEATFKMEEMAKQQMLSNYSVNCYRGTAADDGLLYYAEENNIDMIAMGTHGRRGLAHMFVGSFTEDVINHSNKPVWTFTLRKKNKSKLNTKNETERQYQ